MRAIRNRYFARSAGRQVGPAVLERLASRRDGERYVFRAGLRDLGERLLGRRRDGREPLAGARLDLLAADVEAVAILEAHDVARLGRGGVVPLERRRSAVGPLLDVAHQSIVK